MNKIKTFLRSALEWTLLIFFYVCYVNIRVIYAVHPSQKLDGFREWYGKDTPNQFVTLLAVWLGVALYHLFGLFWVFVIFGIILGLNIVLFLVWLFKKMRKQR